MWSFSDDYITIHLAQQLTTWCYVELPANQYMLVNKGKENENQVAF